MGSVEFETRRYDREQSEGESLLEEAQAYRKQLLDDFMDDRKNERKLLETLADLAGGDSEFLHALERGDAVRMKQLFRDAVDFAYGDELVEKYSFTLEER